MKKAILISLIGLFVLSGCAGIAVPGHVVPSDKPATKTGEASCSVVLFAIFGDCSITAAMKNGEINNPVSLDYKETSFLGLFGKVTAIVSGY